MTTTVYKAAYLPTVAGDSGVWGGYLNTLTFPTFDSALGGITTKTLTNSNVTLSAAESGTAILRLAGTLTGNVVITTACQGLTLVNNVTTGAFTITMQYTGGVGATATIPQGYQSLVVTDATNGAFVLSTPLPANGSFSGTLAVTGATTLSNTLAVTGATTLSTAATLTEIATPTAPAANNVQLYAYTGDFLASQTHGGVQRIYGKDPTVQRLTTGSGTYTPTTGTVRIRVRMCGGGGGGGGSSGGSSGGTTSFDSWTALGGSAGYNGQGASGGPGGIGGSNGTGTLIVRMIGNGGASAPTINTTYGGGQGGSGVFGGQGFGGGGQGNFGRLGNNGSDNSGSGGGGSSGYSGGGAGEYAEFYVSSPTAVSCSIGTGGAGATYGGSGGSGVIIVEEFYN
jgi:hypothetical protein